MVAKSRPSLSIPEQDKKKKKAIIRSAMSCEAIRITDDDC